MITSYSLLHAPGKNQVYIYYIMHTNIIYTHFFNYMLHPSFLLTGFSKIHHVYKRFLLRGEGKC